MWLQGNSSANFIPFIKTEEAKFESKEGIFLARLAPILFTWNDSFDSVVYNGPSQMSSCQIQLLDEQICINDLYMICLT